MDELTIRRAAALFRFASEPVHVEILMGIMAGVDSPRSIAIMLGIGEMTTFYHLRLFRSAGLVTSYRRGMRAHYRLTDRGQRLADVARGLLAMPSIYPATRGPDGEGDPNP